MEGRGVVLIVLAEEHHPTTLVPVSEDDTGKRLWPPTGTVAALTLAPRPCPWQACDDDSAA